MTSFNILYYNPEVIYFYRCLNFLVANLLVAPQPSKVHGHFLYSGKWCRKNTQISIYLNSLTLEYHTSAFKTLPGSRLSLTVSCAASLYSFLTPQKEDHNPSWHWGVWSTDLSVPLSCLLPMTYDTPSKIEPAVPSIISEDWEARFSLGLPILFPFLVVVLYPSPEHMAMT